MDTWNHLVLIFWRQVCEVIYPPKSSSSKNKKSIRFVRMICSMFIGYLVQTGWKLKKLKHTGAFACIFDRYAKKFATDARRYVGWGRGSLRFQHITLIQEIPATTWTCSRLRLRSTDGQQQPVDNFAKDLIEYKVWTILVDTIGPLPDTQKIYTISAWQTIKRIDMSDEFE
jgi:hypothetical protein